jgi:hypothetical protein
MTISAWNEIKALWTINILQGFLKEMERWDNFQIPVTDLSIDEFMAEVNQFRNIDQYFRCRTNPDKTQYEILVLQQFFR